MGDVCCVPASEAVCILGGAGRGLGGGSRGREYCTVLWLERAEE